MIIPAAPFHLSIIALLCPIGRGSLWNWAIAWKRNYSVYSLWEIPALRLSGSHSPNSNPNHNYYWSHFNLLMRFFSYFIL